MMEKKNAKNDKKCSKNIVKIKKSASKRNKKRNKIKYTIVEKCNKQLTKNSKRDMEILYKINEFNTNGRKTIAFFIDSYFPIVDGVVSVLDNYAKFMANYYNVVVCTPKHKKQCYKSENYFVLSSDSVYLKKQGYDLGFPQLDSKFTNYISMLKIDLVHCNAPFLMGMFGLELAKKRHIPSVTTFHSQYREDFYKSTNSMLLAKIMTSFIIKFYDKSTVALTMNEFSKSVMKKYGLKRNDVLIIPNGTNLVYKEFDEELEDKILEKFGVKKDKFTILYIGRFVKVKNIYFILDVLSKLHKTNKNFQFVFMGYGVEEDRMRKIIKENGLGENVIITGKILDSDEKSVIIKNSNLLFFPSYYDTDGIVKIECACFGVPTLCLENTGVSSGIENNVTGFVEKNDVESMVTKLDFLSKNVDFVQKIGKNAKDRMYVSWEDVGQKLRSLYEKLFNTQNIRGVKKNKINN